MTNQVSERLFTRQREPGAFASREGGGTTRADRRRLVGR